VSGAETAHALRATSDALIADLDELTRLEREKRILRLDDPRLEEMSERIEDLAARVLTSTTLEQELSEDARVEAAAGAPSAPAQTIDQTPPRELHTILEEWRAAERRAAQATPRSSEAARAALEVQRLRTEYRRARQRAQQDAQAPDGGPSPGATQGS
jgi:hypothetical protein